jgi:predicted short-subunit dehydrogenase-like oxidoreductase (DUF2520 family)
MRIGILGAGRLGRTLAQLLTSRGHVVELYGRGGSPTADIVFLTVPDSVLAEVARALPLGPIVLHCSGAAEIDVLRPHPCAGSLHPLMTFPGPLMGIPDVTGVPAAIAGDPQALEAARQVATELGFLPFEVSGDRRLYHAAAVMAGNFATVLLHEASTALAACGVTAAHARRMLLPLAVESLKNAQASPQRALTGPVARGDIATIEGHRTALTIAGLDDLVPVYNLLTERALKLLELETPSSGTG